jgi:hypothetical protein
VRRACSTSLPTLEERVFANVDALAARLRAAGHTVSARFTWAASAAEHQEIYASVR